MIKQILRAGYDFIGQYTFYLDKAPEDLSAATLIEWSLKNATKTVELITDTTQDSGASGASWSTGVVILQFSAAQTVGLSPGDGFIEVAVVKGGLRLPYPDIPVTIEAGFTL